MAHKNDILSIDDIKLLVNTFYNKIQVHPLLGPIFNDKIQDRWPEHLEKMIRFWQTILLGEHTYNGAPFAPHARLPLDAVHFDTWIKLFYDTLDELFAGEKVKEAKWRAYKMAEMFHTKIQYFKKNDNSLPLA